MRNFLPTHFDKLLVLLAVFALMTSLGWLTQRQAEVRRLRALPVAVKFSGAAYEPAACGGPKTLPTLWSVPALQSQGWRYELFTPPAIYYDTQAKTFAVCAPQNPVGSEPPFDLELIDVQWEPFPLQLVGYFGAAGNYMAAFTSATSPETRIAREGHRFEDLGLILGKVYVKKIAVKHADPWPVCEVAAFAELVEENTGKKVVLDSRNRRFTDTPQAVLSAPSRGSRVRTVHEGESFDEGKSSYRVDHIQIEPPEVVVARFAPDQLQEEIRKLHPPSQKDRSVTTKASGPKYPPVGSPPEPATTNQ